MKRRELGYRGLLKAEDLRLKLTHPVAMVRLQGQEQTIEMPLHNLLSFRRIVGLRELSQDLRRDLVHASE